MRHPQTFVFTLALALALGTVLARATRHWLETSRFDALPKEQPRGTSAASLSARSESRPCRGTSEASAAWLVEGDFRALPVSEQGVVQGLTILRIRSGSVADRMGLKSGDVVSSAAIESIYGIHVGQTISITVERGVQHLPLSFTCE